MQKRGVYIDDQTIFEKAQESSRQMEIAKWVAMLALGAWQGLSTQVQKQYVRDIDVKNSANRFIEWGSHIGSCLSGLISILIAICVGLGQIFPAELTEEDPTSQ